MNALDFLVDFTTQMSPTTIRGSSQSNGSEPYISASTQPNPRSKPTPDPAPARGWQEYRENLLREDRMPGTNITSPPFTYFSQQKHTQTCTLPVFTDTNYAEPHPAHWPIALQREDVLLPIPWDQHPPHDYEITLAEFINQPLATQATYYTVPMEELIWNAYPPPPGFPNAQYFQGQVPLDSGIFCENPMCECRRFLLQDYCITDEWVPVLGAWDVKQVGRDGGGMGGQWVVGNGGYEGLL